MSKCEILGITANEVKRRREERECGIEEAKRELIREKLLILLEEVKDPAVRMILEVLI